MGTDGIHGCIIKALKEKDFTHEEIFEIIGKILEFEDELKESKAQEIYYEFPSEE